jgi:hypothetical protein
MKLLLFVSLAIIQSLFAQYSLVQVNGQKPPPRRNAGLVYDKLSDRLFLFGGKFHLFSWNSGADGPNNIAKLGDLWIYSFSDKLWTPVIGPPLPPARHSFVFGFDEFNRRLLVSCGQIGSGAPVNDLYEIPLNTMSAKVISLPTVKPSIRYGSTGGISAYNKYMNSRFFYITHGFASNGPIADTFRFDVISNTMDFVGRGPEIPMARYSHGGVATSEFAHYIFGGCSPAVCPMNDTWKYDFNSGWSEIKAANGPSPRSGATMTAIFNTTTNEASDIFLYGGNNGGNEIHLFNIQSNTWRMIYSNATNLQGAASALKVTPQGTSLVYIFGGGDGQGNSQDLYVYNMSYVPDARVSPKISPKVSPKISQTPKISPKVSPSIPVIKCFGKPSTDPQVCSGNGVCNSTDICICKAGFSGIECQHKRSCKSFSGHYIEWMMYPTYIDINITIANASQVSSNQGWAAIGFNTLGSTMNGASIVMGYGSNINEYRANGFQMPTLLNVQKISNKKIDTTNGFKIQFRRPLSDQDTSYFAIKNENLNLLISFNNQTTPTSSTSFVKHTRADVFTINFHTNSECVASLSTRTTLSLILGFISLLCLVF